MTADPRARWAEVLGVPPDASAGAAVAGLLRSLPGTAFRPPVERVAAANALAGTAAPVGRDADVERLLRDEVAALAANYWALPPAARRATWADLSRRSADPVRLKELEPGLDVPSDPLADPAAEELAALVRALFVLPPRARAIRRNGWLLDRAAEAEKWRTASAVLWNAAPALSALEPNLRNALEPAFRHALGEFVEGATTAPVRGTRMSGSVETAGFAERVHRRLGGDTTDADAPEHHRGDDEYRVPWETADSARARKIFWSFPIFVAVCLGFCALNGFVRDRNRGSHVSKPSTPERTAAPDPRGSPAVRSFTFAEVREFEAFERDRAAGTNPHQPPGYTSWRLAGRPPGAAGTKPPQYRPVVEFDREMIQDCREYDRRRSGPKPAFYELWLAAGRPTAPGSYPARSPD